MSFFNPFVFPLTTETPFNGSTVSRFYFMANLINNKMTYGPPLASHACGGSAAVTIIVLISKFWLGQRFGRDCPWLAWGPMQVGHPGALHSAVVADVAFAVCNTTCLDTAGRGHRAVGASWRCRLVTSLGGVEAAALLHRRAGSLISLGGLSVLLFLSRRCECGVVGRLCSVFLWTWGGDDVEGPQCRPATPPGVRT